MNKSFKTGLLSATTIMVLGISSLHANDAQAYDKTIQCNFKKASNYYQGDCWIPNQVVDLAVNFDGLKSKYKKSYFPDKRVNAKVLPVDYGWSGVMQGRKVEDPMLFELVEGKDGKIAYGKLPFGWFYVKGSNISGKKMNITFDVSHQVKPTNDDIKIVQRAKEILSSEKIWNKQDTRICLETDTKYSIFCAMLKAGGEVTGKVHYRQPAMQAFREVLNKIGKARFDKHRIQDWNNHPDTTFKEVHDLFDMTEKNIEKRLNVK